ncbi:DUF262 domain-containing protein [Nocardia sp. AB354]|uniref:DUF262 domain-containing protein n=1 Tax=Nocardia sp. AB354 TaxID=3413283 RepID=UPI003C285D22
MPQLDSETLYVKKLFSQEYFFRVPEYQRPFLWDEDNLSDLITDLLQADQSKDYFLGTLVLHHTGSCSYDIVDGQQRLTALSILLACVRDCISPNSTLRAEIHGKLVQVANELEQIPARNRLTVRDVAVFNSMVADPGGTTTYAVGGNATPGQSRYDLARRIFLEELRKLSEDDVKAFATFVVNRCVLIFLAADDLEEAFRLFTVVNDRGKQLRRIDILKAQNISPHVIASDEVRRRYAQKWEEMEDRLGEQSFEDLFHLLRMIYVKDKPQQDLLKEFENRIFERPGMPNRGGDFLDKLEAFVDLYESIFIDRDILEGEEDDARFKTMMWAMSGNFSASEWRACVLAYAHAFNSEGLYEYLLAVEKVYLSHWVAGMRKDERYSVYTTLLKAIDSSKDGAGALQAATGYADRHSIREACMVQNFYKAGYCKYLLLRAEISFGELNGPREFRVRSVEHVLPQNPAPGSSWRRWVPARDHAKVVDTAGNLVLLSKGKNSAASNRELGDKKTTYLKPRVSDFPRCMEVLSYDRWDVDVIDARTQSFAELVLQDP